MVKCNTVHISVAISNPSLGAAKGSFVTIRTGAIVVLLQLAPMAGAEGFIIGKETYARAVMACFA